MPSDKELFIYFAICWPLMSPVISQNDLRIDKKKDQSIYSLLAKNCQILPFYFVKSRSSKNVEGLEKEICLYRPQ